MATSALASHIASPSAAMKLTNEDKQVLIFDMEGFQLPAPSPCWEMIVNASAFFIIAEINLHFKGSQIQSGNWGLFQMSNDDMVVVSIHRYDADRILNPVVELRLYQICNLTSTCVDW